MNALRRLSVVSVAAVVCLAPVLVPAGADESAEQPVAVSLLIVETTPEVLSEAENALGFSLDPTHGRCVLDAGEQAALAAAVTGKEPSSVLARASVVCLPGQEAVFKSVETVRIPERYAAAEDPTAPGKLQVRATEYTTREMGVSFEPSLLGAPSGGAATMILKVNLSRVSGWREMAPGINEPIIKSWDLTTAARVPLGRALVLVNRPYGPFEPRAEEPAPAPDSEPKPRPQPVVLIVIGAE